MKEVEFSNIKLHIENVIHYIDILDSIGLDVEKEKNKVSKYYQEINIDDDLIWVKNEEAYQIYNELFRKYDTIVSINLFFDGINLENVEGIYDNIIKEIIRSLEELRDSDFFLDDNFSNFIFKIYNISYEYMKLEFLFCEESSIYDYFSRYLHDVNYINSIIFEEVGELKNSINYDKNLRSLLDIYKDNYDYLDKNVILKLAMISYPKENEENIEERLHDLWIQLEVFSLRLSFESIILSADKLNSLKSEYEELKNKYERFILERNVDLEEHEIMINRIKRESRRIEEDLVLKKR